MFYFDKNIEKYEIEYSWDRALVYLKEKFQKEPSVGILNSLVGFSWYYLIEGPIYSGKYENDDNNLQLEVWNEYMKIGLNEYINYESFCFIAGYTLLLNGYYLNDYRKNNEVIGMDLLYKAAKTTNPYLKELTNNIIKMQYQKKYKPLKINNEVCNHLFFNGSLLEKYFIEVFS